MNAIDAEKSVTENSDKELQSILARPHDFQSALVDAARSQLRFRGVEIPAMAQEALKESQKTTQQLISLLTITVITSSATHRYSEPITRPNTVGGMDDAMDRTFAKLRADILLGILPRDANVTIETTIRPAKPQLRSVTLIKFASKFQTLASLYTPVRCHARSGLAYGIVLGAILHLLYVGIVVTQVNETYGPMILALPFCLAVMFAAMKLKSTIFTLIGAVALNLIMWSFKSSFGVGMVIGAAISGALLWGTLGMTVGATLAAMRLPRLPRAYDAPQENITLRIATPFAATILLWTAYAIWARHYLTTLMHSN